MNINDLVTVILSKYGQQVLENYKKDMERGGNINLDSIFKYDRDGKYTTEMWNLMNIFGKHMYMGAENVFLNNQIYTNE